MRCAVNSFDEGPRGSDGCPMRLDQIWDEDAARRYDTPGAGMFAPETVDPVVARIAGSPRVAGHSSSPSGPAASRSLSLSVESPYPESNYLVSHHFNFDTGERPRLFRTPQRDDQVLNNGSYL